MNTQQLIDLDRILLEDKLGLPNAYTGPFPKTTTHAKHQPMCGDCGQFAAQIIWKDDLRNSNTWFYAECDTCEAYLCEDCKMVDDDVNTCQCCLEQSLHSPARINK